MSGIQARYNALVEAGELRPDQEQAAVAARLELLQSALEKGEDESFLGKLFGKKSRQPQGVYMWGGVGRGKSMLMDLFHATLEIEGKRRAHFHAFMQDVHRRLREARKSETGDPIPPVAADIGKDLQCLAFDEMVVNNSADAMIMSRLFRALIVDEGVSIVATSNRPPHDLYKDGLNREHFLPFIALIEQRLDVLPLNGPTDYRLDRLGDLQNWHTPLGDAATAQVREAFFRLTDYEPEDGVVPSMELAVGEKRSLHVPRALKGRRRFQLQTPVRRSARGAGLSRNRARISHRHHRRHPLDGARYA